MAATQTVPQLSEHCNFIPIEPRHGVVTLFGYGIDVRVDRGHLIIHDGIGSRRTTARFARIGHGIRRLVVIGNDGTVTLSALRWLADQDASFVMLDRKGSVLATTGPVRPSDARLRRAQALAYRSEVGLQISQELLDQKLVAQERLIREKFHDTGVAAQIASAREKLPSANSIDDLRFFESQAAKAYWGAWRNVPIMFAKADLRRVPDHWLKFGLRASPLTGSPRLAVNPPNAMLNYLYALLESEARLAAAALGLDPGLGVLHFDSRTRDSLASDLMEPIRPRVDAYVFDWINREPLRREWFFEQPDGNCRLVGSFAARLSETAQTWAWAVAPVAESVCRKLWSTMRKPAVAAGPATRLTQQRRSRTGEDLSLRPVPVPHPPSVCRICGTAITCGNTLCKSCALNESKTAILKVAQLGRTTAHNAKAQARRSETMRRQMTGRTLWKSSDLPKWLTERVYREEIRPKLAAFTIPAIALTLAVSKPYATDIRTGKRVPHPRHWRKLAELVGFTGCKRSAQEIQC
ncbi:MAG: CRISPR-associated endonuclease Cas1 [Candidatus Acidiferrales bacterium]